MRLYPYKRKGGVDVSIGPENQALKDSQRIYVHKMVYEGLDRLDAYVQSHDVELTDENIDSIRRRANYIFHKPNVNRYYHALLEEVQEKEQEKGLWTREIATKKLFKLIERAEEDIYGEDKKPVTMARLNAIILPAKELNTMHGYNNTTNLNIDGTMGVQIYGESEIPD